MTFSSNAIKYSTIMTITRAKELVKTCTYADVCLTDVLKHLPEDELLSEKQKQIVLSQAIATREVLQRSIKLFGEVVKKWEMGLVSGKEPRKEDEL